MKETQLLEPTEQSQESAMAEYAAAHEAYLHYDNFSWQVGAVIVVGVFVFWGLLIDKQPDAGVLLVANLLISLFMSIWLLYTEHNRQLYLFKIHRLHELEQKLGMSQHRRFKHWGEREPLVYMLDHPRGRYLDDAVFALISLGGPTLDVVARQHFLSLALNGVLVVLVVAWVHIIDARAKSVIRKLEDGGGT